MQRNCKVTSVCFEHTKTERLGAKQALYRSILGGGLKYPEFPFAVTACTRNKVRTQTFTTTRTTKLN
jgi:hypothetical protein